MIKQIGIAFIILFLFSCQSFSQLLPKNTELFKDTEISVVKIEIDPDYLNEILAPGNEESDQEFPAVFIFQNSIVSDTVRNIGFRLRGNTSRYSNKKSFKVSFNTFLAGNKYRGVEKINLNGEHNDPSIIRTKISFNLFKYFGIPASRTNHVELYINNEFKGLYINVEHVDEAFVRSRFMNNKGNLYKCLWPATLLYIDDNPDSYKFVSGERRAYDLKTNTDEDDYSDLANFIDILNNTDSENLHTELEPVFNVNLFLKYLAIEILTGHWDAYSFNKNNFYLYHNMQTDKFVFIPYDLDNTFGIDWYGIDWALRNIYNWAHDSEPRPLTKRILQNQIYRDRFSFYINLVLNNFFDPGVFFSEIDDIKSMIAPSAENDTYRTLDYDWSIQDFHNSYIQALSSGHITYGLKPYITARHNSGISQIVLNSISPAISRIWFSDLIIDTNTEVFVFVEDEDIAPVVTLHYSINSETFSEIIMTDNGSGNDSLANDNIFSCFIPIPLSEPGTLDFYISGEDSDFNTSLEPLNGYYRLIIPEQSELELYINEIMASNSSTVDDEYREFDDWVEIYNGGTKTVWLGDKYLSDNSLNPTKWQMPELNLMSGEFLHIWADNTTGQGEFHTNFLLNSEGEELGIYDSESENYAEIDLYKFGPQYTDLTIGRYPDGLGEFVTLAYPTPGYTNSIPLNLKTIKKNDITVFPNPFYDHLNVQITNIVDKNIIIKIQDITGRILSEQYFSGKKTFLLKGNFLNFKSGMYILSVLEEQASGTYNLIDNKLIIKK